MLVEADDVSARIAEARGNFRRVRTDGLHDFATVGNDGVDRCCHAVHKDVKEQADGCAGRASEHPRAAYCADRVIKRSATVTAFADVPVEDFFVEVSRVRDVCRRQFDVADFAVRHSGRHECSFGRAIPPEQYTVLTGGKFPRMGRSKATYYPATWN